MRYVVGSAVVFAVALLPTAAGAGAHAPAEPPTIRLQAEFVPARFVTRYTAVFRAPGARVRPKSIVFDWTFTAPRNDRRCDLFDTRPRDRRASFQPQVRSVATWLHGDHHRCDHRKEGPNGHRGAVGVVVIWRGHDSAGVFGVWSCKARILGSNTTFPRPQPCVRVARR